MTSSGWSSLLVGTILATTAYGPAFGEEAGFVPTSARQEMPIGSTADLVVDQDVLAAAMIDAARAGDRVTDEMVDRILTGAIFAITPGPSTGGLTEVRAPSTGGLTEPKPAPEPLRAKATPTAAPAAKSEPTKSTATASVTPAAVTEGSAAAGSAAVEKPAASGEPSGTAAAAPIETPSAAPVEASVAPSAAPVEAAVAPTPVTPTDAVAAPDKAAEIAPVGEATKPTDTAAVAPAADTTSAPVTAGAVPVDTAPTAVAAVDPASTPSYSTASEPTVKPAESATTAPASTAEPVKAEPAGTASVATPPPAVATPAAPTPSVVATPAPVPAVPSTVNTDAAIAATLAAEQAAAALKAALEEIQPRAGTVEERADRAALLAFHANRAFLPLFVDALGTTDRGRAVRTVLARADVDGLEPRAYRLPLVGAGLSPEARAKAEIEFGLTVVRYARHLQSGRFEPRRVHELVTPKAPKTEASEVLDRLAGTTAVADVLAAYAPPHPGYLRLKALLAELRSAGEDQPMVMVPAGPLLKPGQKDARVALLRERLGVTGVVSDAEVFDPTLAEAVMTFQRDRGLAPTGKVGRETVSALNDEKTGTTARIADVVSNMERWRWLPHDLGEMHVFVNTADFHLDVMKDGRSIHHAKVIVGKPSNPTPIFSEDMRHVVVNPYWNVPYSIVKKEMIGKAQSTAGGALARGGWEVEVGRHRVDPTTVDWSTVDASKVTIRQRPGDGNALGNIKFLFPNQHAVYLHDTSSRSLFAQKFRALSHGCVRVHEPFSFADAVLSEEPEKLDGAKLKKMIGGGEKTINLKRLVPVHITYFTAWVDDAGQLQTRPDIYGHDARVKRLLEL